MAGAIASLAVAAAGIITQGVVGGMAGALLGAVVMTGLSYVASAIIGQDVPDVDMSFDTGLLSNKSGADATLPVVYGSRLMGGYRVLVRSTDKKNRVLHIVLAVCHGPIHDIPTVYLDGIDSTDEKFNNRVTITKYLGTDDQEADPTLVEEVEEWTTEHRLRGVAYVYARLVYHPKTFSSIPEITCKVEGLANIYDPRDGLDKYTDNPALCTRDYCTNTRYGRGIDPAAFPDAYVISEANHCDSLVSKGGTEAKRYTCNGALDTEQSLLENTRALLSSFRGVLIFSGGAYKLRSDRIDTSSFSLTDDNVNIEQITTKLGSLTNTYNKVEAKFFNPGEDSQYDYALWDDENARLSDNGRELKTTIDLKYTNDQYTALQIATLTGKASRWQVALELVAQPEGILCDVFDVIDVTLEQYGFAQKLFRVLEMKIRDDGLVTISLLEYDDGAYDFGTIPFKAARARTTLPDNTDPGMPTDLTMESGEDVLFVRGDGTVASRIKVAWVAPDDAFVTIGGSVELQYRKSGMTTWNPGPIVDGEITTAYLTDVEDGLTYEVRARSENRAGYQSDWTEAVPHKVIGKTASPADVVGFSAQQNGSTVTYRWQQVVAKELKGYEIRYAKRGFFVWPQALPVTSVTRGTLITNAALPPGAWTLGIKAVDTSDNYSEAAATYDIEVVNEYDVVAANDESGSWLGVMTNLIKHDVSGALVPVSGVLACDQGWETFDEFCSESLEGVYEGAEIDLGFDATARVYAELGGALPNGVPDPRFEIDHAMDGGGYDGFEGWTVGTIRARKIKPRVVVPAGRPCALSACRPVADVAEREERDVVTVPVGGLSVEFSQRYHSPPGIQLSAGGAEMRQPVYSDTTTTGFTITVYNSAGEDVGGEASYIAKGA